MGGPGSGEWTRISHRPTTEEFFSLDIRVVVRLGLLPLGDNFPIQLDYTSCHLGGQRPWWLCPGCARRVAILYRRCNRFNCRHCHGLAYSSRQLGKLDRAFAQMWKARRKIGSNWQNKPKGMHWSTFRRLSVRSKEAEQKAYLEVLRWIDKQRGGSCPEFTPK
jgi:hypothetical protein